MEVLDHDELLVQAQELEPLPATSTRLASLVANPNSDMNAIVEAISLDSALTVKLLRIANSAASGARSEIATVNAAVMRIGTGSVLSIAVAAGIRGRMMEGLEGYGLEEGQLWQHSVATALAAESLGGICQAQVPPESFTAALLHDVGKLVLARYLRPEVVALLHRARAESGASLSEAEQELLDVDHAELGGVVARHWKLPRAIVAGIEHHHRPEAGSAAGEALEIVPWVVHLADLVANGLGFGASSPPPADAEFEEPLAALGLDRPGLEKLMYRTQLRIDEVGERFS